MGDHLERTAFCERASRSRDRSRPNAVAKPAAHMDNCTSQSSRHYRADDARRQNCSHSPGTHPDPRDDLGNAVSGQIDDCIEDADPDRLGDNPTSGVARTSRRDRLRAGQRRRTHSARHYFSSPGFTDERGYFFLARPVQRCKEGAARDEEESILDCREFTVEQIRRMIAENEIRDANTLSICAILAVHGLLSLSPR